MSSHSSRRYERAAHDHACTLVGEDKIEFTLTYRGKLLGASRSNTRADEKQRLREHFGRQLERIWKDDTRFRDIDPNSLQEPVLSVFDPFDVARPIQDWRGFFFRQQ